MTISLFHGDDTAASRNNLFTLKQKQVEIRELNGEKITPKDFETILGTESLFGEEALLIENLFSRTRSKDKEACIELLKNYQGHRTILCWDKKALTKATTAKLPKTWKIIESKPPAILFAFLDAFKPGNHAQARTLLVELRKNSDDGLIFVMLSRHVISLIQAQSATTLKLPPWQIGKLKAQASLWTEGALIHVLDELHRIDLQIKTGITKLDQGSQLDILLLSVLG